MEWRALVNMYWEHYRLSLSDAHADQVRSTDLAWAWERVDLVAPAPEEATALLVDLADAAPGDSALAYLGAGPIEDLVIYHGSAFVIDRVEDAARRNENFRKALRCAWYDAHVEPAVRTRLRSFGDPY